jgi:hypothetical protein
MSRQTLERLEAQLAKHTNERGALVQQLPELAETEHATRVEWIAKNPGRRSDADIGGPVATIRKKRAKAEKAIEGLDSEIRALEAAIAGERSALAREELSRRLTSMRSSSKDEMRLREEFGRLFEQLYDKWLEYGGLIEQRDRFRSEIELSGLLEHADDDQRRTLDNVTAFPILPVAVDFRRELERVFETAFDSGSAGYRNRDQSSAYFDYGRRLPEVVPDLRGKARYLQLSGKVERTSSLRPAAEGRQPPGTQSEEARLAESSEAAQAAAALLMAEAGVTE